MHERNLRVLVTGADGFIGRNLIVRLGEEDGFSVTRFIRGDGSEKLARAVSVADVIVHLAGENRPTDESAFAAVNEGLTRDICDAIARVHAREGRAVSLILASSIHAGGNTAYGRSKLAAEKLVSDLVSRCSTSAIVYRFPGVFGKWCRPNYNSVVATFCHNAANGLPIKVNDPSISLKLVHIDDVVASLISDLRSMPPGLSVGTVEPIYSLTVGELAQRVSSFERLRGSLMSDSVGAGLTRALYSTYISYLPPSRFSYPVPKHADPRGVFVEMLKTPDSGQFSFFTAHPGVTRGGHYHHTKTEKFLVIRGEALFRFRNLLTGERIELRTRGANPQVVDTIPGWAHDITNEGDGELIVMLWANENFDRMRPDTVASEV
jgi:UDP-2-acetamido-2,6-beta-L-arabino-hexul-4-ose reductase